MAARSKWEIKEWEGGVVKTYQTYPDGIFICMNLAR